MKTKKASTKSRKSKKRKTSIKMPSTMSPTKTEQISKIVQIERTSKRPGVIKKAQCDLCKLSYSTEKELSEHLLSIMHHTKMEDKEENPVHVCNLCFVTSASMADYRNHVTTDKHQKMLLLLRGEADNKSQLSSKRPDTWTAESSDLPTSKFGSKPFNNNNHQFQKDNQSNKVPVVGKWFGGDSNNQSSYFKFRGNSNAHKSKKVFGNGSYFSNDYRWHRDPVNTNYSGQYEKKHIGGSAGPLDSQHTNNCYEPWGSGFYGEYYEYDRTTDLPMSSWRDEDFTNRWRMNYDGQNEVTARFNCPNLMAAVRNTIPEAWDEQLLLQQEQFVAGMDDGHFSSRHYAQQWPHSTNSDRQKQYNSCKKWAQDEYGGEEESPAKRSGFKCFSSDQGAPGHEIQEVHPTAYDLFEEHKKSRAKLSPNSNARTPTSNAERTMLNSLEMNKEILKAKNALVKSLKNTVYTDFDKKGYLLQQKQRDKYAAKVSERPHSNKEPSSDFSSTSSLQSSHASSVHSASSALFTVTTHSQNKTIRNTLEDIKKSIEKNVLLNGEKLQEKIKSPAPPKSKRIRCSSGSSVPGATSDSATVTALKPVPKLGYKVQLDKDSLKKIINAPHSRDERLQLAKMLQPRDGQKSATTSVTPRTNLQHKGVHDSFVVSPEVTVDTDQNHEIQTIKLEDLSDLARLQILDLIGHEVSSRFHCPSEHNTEDMSVSDKLIKENPSSKPDVIVLSDDDIVNKTSKHKKRTSQTDSNNSSIKETVDVKKTKRSKSVSKTYLTNSDVPSTCIQDDSEMSYEQNTSLVSEVKKSDISRSKKRISQKKKTTVLCINNAMEIVLCSSDEEELDQPDKRKKTCQDFSKTTIVNTVPYSPFSSSTKQDTLEIEAQSSKLPSEQTKSMPNCSTEREKSPAATIESKSIVNINRANCSSSQTLQNIPGRVPDNLLVSSNVQTNPQFSVVHADTEMKSDIEIWSISPQSKSSLLHKFKQSSPGESTRPQCQDSDSLSINGTRPQCEDSDSLSINGTRPQCEDSDSLSLAAPQKSSVETAEFPATPNTSSPGTRLLKRLSLPPSTWLKNRQPPPDNCESSSRPASVEPSLLSPAVKDPKIEDGTGAATVITDDEDNFTTADGEQMSSNQMNCATSAVTKESSCRVMSELLVLSEREENVKQEKMSLDLRLNRLHKLLEQAVVQINQCTERRQQLHKEEQELSHQRMSLLRAILSPPDASASSLNPSLRCDARDQLNSGSSGSNLTPDDHVPAPPSSMPFGEACKEAAQGSDHHQGTSLSRADWLAKFSSFLPRDPSRGNQAALSRALPITSQLELKEHIHPSNLLVPSINLSASSDLLASERGTLPGLTTLNLGVANQDSCSKSFNKAVDVKDKPLPDLPSDTATGSCMDIVKIQSDEGLSGTSTAASVPIKAAPIMYLGSFKRADAHESVGMRAACLKE